MLLITVTVSPHDATDHWHSVPTWCYYCYYHWHSPHMMLTNHCHSVPRWSYWSLSPCPRMLLCLLLLITVTVSPDDATDKCHSVPRYKVSNKPFSLTRLFLYTSLTSGLISRHFLIAVRFPDICRFLKRGYIASRTVSDKVLMAQWVTSLDLPACCCDAMSDGFLTDIVKLANHLMTVSWHSDMVCDMLPVTPTRFSGISATTHTYAHIIHCPLVDCLTCKMDRRTWHTVRNY